MAKAFRYRGYQRLVNPVVQGPLARPKQGKVQIVKEKKRRRKRYQSFPPKQNVKQKDFYKLTYADSVQLTTATSSSGEYVFRLNSLYDVDSSGTGHQPYGHDTLATLWTRYRVDKVLVEVVGHTLTAHNGYTFYMRVGDTISLNNTLTSSYIKESGGAEYIKEIMPLHTAVGLGNHFKARKMFKCKKYATQGFESTPNYGANFGSNPTDSIFLIIGHCSDTTTSFTVYAHVKFTLYFQVSEPLALSQS